uniref:protein ecdysoneless homolog n=1 Tax=Myxine glutinosa TaxID=7769 RepID=UPI00358F6095
MASHAFGKKVIPEDSVRYKLFLQPSSPARKLSRDVLECYRDQVLGSLAPWLVGYIWQNERFGLHYRPPKGEDPAHLAGVTDFGDNIEDEWFIVFLLREVTVRFPELFAWVEDVDGQFLLIESANHLPRWLNPDSCCNRVFLRRGEIHIIPPSRVPGDTRPEPSPLKLQSALDILAQNGDKYLAGEMVRRAVGRRVDCHSVKPQENLHHAYCILPAVLASLLQRHPQLVAPAVQAFYLRDPLDLRACRIFSAFSPEPSVLTMVTFTRCLYAQLCQQAFHPDRRSGFVVPPPSHPRHKAHSLGMKLAHGFEILCARSKKATFHLPRGLGISPREDTFLKSLKSHGYFQGELEGSQRYQEQLRAAQAYFNESIIEPRGELDQGEEVLLLLKDTPVDLKDLTAKEKALPPEDDDSWLNISPEGLDRLLQEAAGTSEAQAKNKIACKAQAEDYNLSEMAKGVKAFVKKVSSHDGAEMPWSPGGAQVELDSDQFIAAVQKILGNDRKQEMDLDSDDLEEEQDEFEEDDLEVEDEYCEAGESSEDEDGEAGARSEDVDTAKSLRSLMYEMDLQLQGTTMGQSFSGKVKQTKMQQNLNSSDEEDTEEMKKGEDEENEQVTPVDIDLNLVQNLLESLGSQEGLAGPVANILHGMGITLPPATDT